MIVNGTANRFDSSSISAQVETVNLRCVFGRDSFFGIVGTTNKKIKATWGEEEEEEEEEEEVMLIATIMLLAFAYCNLLVLVVASSQYHSTGTVLQTAFWYCLHLKLREGIFRVFRNLASAPNFEECQEIDAPLKARCVSSTHYSFVERLH